MPVALVSEPQARHLDEDLPPLVAALGVLGIDARICDWDDPGVAWPAFDLAVVRSPWDYFRRRPEFLRWAERVEAVTRLLNPADVLAWNTDKRYLGELAAAGLPVVPTSFVASAQEVDGLALPTSGDVVVKPTVSAGSNDTTRHATTAVDDVGGALRQILDGGRVAMVQPYLERVEEHGETALVFIDGAFSHALRKGPILVPGMTFVEGLFAEEDMSPRDPSAQEREVAERVMDAVPGGRGRLLYGRVDLVPGPDGAPVVLELELTEPSLFLPLVAGTAERLARAIAERLPG